VQAQTKIEELNSVKAENERTTKQYEEVKKRLQISVKEIEGLRKSQEEMQKKYVEMEKKAAEAPATGSGAGSSHEQNLSHYRQRRQEQQTQSRSSRSSTFFQELAKTSMLGGRKMDSAPQGSAGARGSSGVKAVNSAEAQKHLQAQEDNFTDIIYKLQHDRMRLTGKDLNERLSKMSKSGGAFNEYIKSHSDRAAMNIKLSRDKQELLSKAVENVDNLRQSTKVQLACVKVVNLK
jgi:hypothetical protein